MPFLIDGYNLLHALGLLQSPPAPHGLERARDRLLEWLAERHPAPGDVLVVFDARQAARGDDAERLDRGVRVRFSTGQNADDLIEEIIRREPAPARLTVVSNDHRIQQAARRRKCPAWGCERLIDWLEGLKPHADPHADDEATPEKPEGVSDEEVQYWLREFGEH